MPAMRQAILIAALLFSLGVNLDPCKAGEVGNNARIMRDAASSLTFSLPENRAYMLEKRSGAVLSQVAVIFGYVDNAAACREIADALTEQGALRRQFYKFECNPIDG